MNAFAIMRLLFAALLLSACAVQDDSEKPAAETLKNSALVGEWRVIMLDDAPVQPVILHADDDAIYWEPDCAGWAISYSIDGSTIDFGNQPDAAAREVCDIGYPAELPRAFKAFAQATTIARNRDGTISLIGPDHSVVLAPAAKPFDRAVENLTGEWRLTILNGHEITPQQTARFTGDAQQIGWTTTCARRGRRYAIVGTRFAAEPLADLPPIPPRPPGSTGPPPPTRTTCAIGVPPGVTGALAVMDIATTIKPSGDDGVYLSNGKGQDITLERIDTPERLTGEWRVAGIDGRELVGDIGIAVTIEGSRLHYESTCVGFVWDYTYGSGAIATSRAASPNARPAGVTPPPVCAVRVSPELGRLAAAFDAVSSARYSAAGGVRLSGGGRSVTLFSQ